MKIFWKVILIILGILVIGNLGALDWITVSSKFNPSTLLRTRVQNAKLNTEEIVVEEKVASASCELSCQDIIEQKIQEELARIPSPAGQSSVPSVNPVSVSTNGSKAKIVYIPLINDGIVSSSTWTDVIPSEFYFNLADYPSVKEVRFEAYLSSVNDDPGYARIYDNTNKRGVDFSDLSFNKNTFTRFESHAIVIWRGSNKYTVQLRSANGTQVSIKDAKLKILY